MDRRTNRSRSQLTTLFIALWRSRCNNSMMTTNSSRSIFKHALAPVILVGSLWIGMSSATTLYVLWLERSHERVFTEEVASLRRVKTIQILVWRIAAECPDNPGTAPDFRLRWNETAALIDEQRRQMEGIDLTAEERPALLKMESKLTEFVRLLDLAVKPPADRANSQIAAVDEVNVRNQVIGLASQISAATKELLTLNQQSTDRDVAHRRQIGRIVLWTRISMIVVGPLLGVLLGWRLAGLMRRSIARIAVTLHDAQNGGESSVGTIDIDASGDVHDLQQQAEKVAERMRQVSDQLQNARQEILRSERLAAVGELAAGVAHEIRNPLTSIKLLLQHAARQASSPTLNQNKLGLILEEINRMETTIQGLLDFSRPPRLNRVAHDLRQTLQRALNLIDARARQQQVEIVTRLSERPLIVAGDSEKLHQVMVNVLINAIEAMSDGGRLTITTNLVNYRPLLERSTLPVGQSGSETQMVQVEFLDTGPGIPDDLMSRLFEPFATTKERGTGLGLAVTHRIVEEHQGTILAANIPGGGARFTLLIPAAPVQEVDVPNEDEMHLQSFETTNA